MCESEEWLLLKHHETRREIGSLKSVRGVLVDQPERAGRQRVKMLVWRRGPCEMDRRGQGKWCVWRTGLCDKGTSLGVAQRRRGDEGGIKGSDGVLVGCERLLRRPDRE